MNSMMPIVASQSDPIPAFSHSARHHRHITIPAESSLVLGERCDVQLLTGFPASVMP
jgi:hypothetical protein